MIRVEKNVKRKMKVDVKNGVSRRGERDKMTPKEEAACRELPASVRYFETTFRGG
jgi:hypothetical protein